MYNSKSPAENELPSTSQLLKSTVLAIIGAGVLLVTVVMPAEYGIDPTGFGKLSGLQNMGKIKVSLEKEAQEDANKNLVTPTEDQASSEKTLTAQDENAESDERPTVREDVMTLTLEPDEGAEIKVTLGEGEIVNFEWVSSGKVNFDNHGDSKDLNIDYHPYNNGLFQLSDAGAIEAAFDGNHGWFWRNRTSETVSITLTTNGPYSWIGRVD